MTTPKFSPLSAGDRGLVRLEVPNTHTLKEGASPSLFSGISPDPTTEIALLPSALSGGLAQCLHTAGAQHHLHLYLDIFPRRGYPLMVLYLPVKEESSRNPEAILTPWPLCPVSARPLKHLHPQRGRTQCDEDIRRAWQPVSAPPLLS